MMLLFGLDYERWLRIIAWAEGQFGAPRVMSPVRALLWSRMKWQQASEPPLPETFSPSSARLLFEALATI